MSTLESLELCIKKRKKKKKKKKKKQKKKKDGWLVGLMPGGKRPQ
jgi:hypothetical protein